VAGVTRLLDFTATVTQVTPGAITLRAETVDRATFGLTWNQMGALKGLATVSVVTRFTRPAAKSTP
jgi:hypothetical protein